MGKQGQSLLEVMIALAVILLVIVALVRGIIISVQSSEYSKKSAQAASFAQEGMEFIRIYRDSSWTNFWAQAESGANWGLSGEVPGGTCATGAIPGTPFIRCVVLEQIDLNPDLWKVKATLTVKWDDSKGTHKSDLVSYFTKWK